MASARIDVYGAKSVALVRMCDCCLRRFLVVPPLPDDLDALAFRELAVEAAAGEALGGLGSRSVSVEPSAEEGCTGSPPSSD